MNLFFLVFLALCIAVITGVIIKNTLTPTPPPLPTDPTGPPTIPILQDLTTRSITVTFDVAGITGTGGLTFTALYGTVTQGAINLIGADLLSQGSQGSLYEATALTLSRGTAYVFKSQVASDVGSVVSALSQPFTTLQ